MDKHKAIKEYAVSMYRALRQYKSEGDSNFFRERVRWVMDAIEREMGDNATTRQSDLG